MLHIPTLPPPSLHPSPVTATVTPGTVLGEVRRANLRGRLYRDTSDPARQQALEELAAELAIEAVGPTATDVGGWFALPAD